MIQLINKHNFGVTSISEARISEKSTTEWAIIANPSVVFEDYIEDGITFQRRKIPVKYVASITPQGTQVKHGNTYDVCGAVNEISANDKKPYLIADLRTTITTLLLSSQGNSAKTTELAVLKANTLYSFISFTAKEKAGLIDKMIALGYDNATEKARMNNMLKYMQTPALTDYYDEYITYDTYRTECKTLVNSLNS